MSALYIVLGLVVLLIVTLISGIRIVPQGKKYIVQRLGKFNKVLEPGLNIIWPYFDVVAFKVPTREIVLDIPEQEVITKDNAVIKANAVAYFSVNDVEKAVYSVQDYVLALRNIIQTSLRSIIGDMKLDDALSSREQIKVSLKESISDDIEDWGLSIKTVEIQDITPSMAMQTAMEEQAAAERSRRAAVTTADGEKEAAIKKAEGELEASKKQAEAVELLANASSNAIKTVSESMTDDNQLTAMYLLGERYIESINNLSQSDNTKTFIYPADLPQAIKGMLQVK